MRDHERTNVIILFIILIGNLHAHAHNNKNHPLNKISTRVQTTSTNQQYTRITNWNMPELKRINNNLANSRTTLAFQDNASKPSPPPPKKKSKKLILIRHGCTYMNEYLSTPGSTWGDPNFTDIFQTDHEHTIYRDSPLSELGVKQAEGLSGRFASSSMEEEGEQQLGELQPLLDEIEVIAVSPLNRALQTLEIGLLPHLGARTIPILALPIATERLYLISDLGSSPSTLSKRYPFVDFTTEFRGGDEEEEWWFTVTPDSEPSTSGNGGLEESNTKFQASLSKKDYIEWRPIDQGQTYACPGEPDDVFNGRMKQLYEWIEEREESTICIVCHWGVLEWLTGERFENCEVRVVDFDDVKCFDSDTSNT